MFGERKSTMTIKNFLTFGYTLGFSLLGWIITSPAQSGSAQGSSLPNLFPFPNANGVLETFSANGSVDLTNPFFQNLGTNGRSCASCHAPDQGWTIAASAIKRRFEATNGLDPS